jgi:hypothetical protein
MALMTFSSLVRWRVPCHFSTGQTEFGLREAMRPRSTGKDGNFAAHDHDDRAGVFPSGLQVIRFRTSLPAGARCRIDVPASRHFPVRHIE